jgi:hypothetical protein
MAKSTLGNLKHRVNNLFDKDNKPITIKNENDCVTVNGTKIYRKNSCWVVGDTEFVYKKSAVGWIISKINGDISTANAIKEMDRKVSQTNDDVFWYNTQYNRSKIKHKKDVFQARLSNALPMLQQHNKQLNQKLKTVKMT